MSRDALCFDAHEIGPWVCERAGGDWVAGRGTAIGLKRDEVLIAGVLFEDHNGANIIGHIRGDGNWATRQFLGTIFDYPFNQLKVRRITAPIASTNLQAINIVEKMGFKLECTLAQATPDGDMHLFRMWRDDCRYLRGKYALRRSS